MSTSQKGKLQTYLLSATRRFRSPHRRPSSYPSCRSPKGLPSGRVYRRWRTAASCQPHTRPTRRGEALDHGGDGGPPPPQGGERGVRLVQGDQCFDIAGLPPHQEEATKLFALCAGSRALPSITQHLTNELPGSSSLQDLAVALRIQPSLEALVGSPPAAPTPGHDRELAVDPSSLIGTSVLRSTAKR